MLAYPFRFRANGRGAEVADDSDEAYAQQIALLLLIRPGERPLLPEYGTPDPVYDVQGVDPALVTAAIAAFGPPVTVTDVTQAQVAGQPGVADVVVSFNS